MNTLEKFQITRQGKTSTDEALKLFDELDTVDLKFMMGRWKGSGFHTNHPMDGLLETIGWYGKEFVSADSVHPLLFSDGNKIFKVDLNPTATNLGLNISIPKNDALKPFYSLTLKMFKTEESKARVRMMEHRGKVSATMIYDYLPINDIFRKVNENTVLGLMDFKAMQQPFFFVLDRSI
ncbi:DUF4334 domain-containing protein [Pleurocapsa sp. FMAR1]|uniref:DUF4334 domain-containing protein n=1 Tax=Pleurocapsa sp. FMAR1 TaxID=3040204 RepID=UPI0039AED60C